MGMATSRRLVSRRDDMASGQEENASSSEICPAGHPVFAVKLTRRYLGDVAGNVIVTVFPVAGLKV